MRGSIPVEDVTGPAVSRRRDHEGGPPGTVRQAGQTGVQRQDIAVMARIPVLASSANRNRSRRRRVCAIGRRADAEKAARPTLARAQQLPGGGAVGSVMPRVAS